MRGARKGDAMTTLQNDALEYIERGFSVLPLHNPLKGGHCSCLRADCGAIGKHPRTPHGVKDATRDRAALQMWFDAFADPNIGIATGTRSGFFALDIDPRSGGRESLDALVSQYGKLPDTPEVITGGGGTHLYFKQPGFAFKNTTIAPGVEIKTDGKYIAAPNSLHASGQRYTFDALASLQNTPIHEAPDWLLHLLSAATPDTDRAAYALADTPRGFPRVAWHILKGTSNRAYLDKRGQPDQSAAEQAAITAFVNAGWNFAQVRGAFEKYAHAETHYKKIQKTRGQREADRWLQFSFDRAVSFAQANQTPEYTAALEAAHTRRVWALETPFEGRGGATQFKVILAHCAIVEKCGRNPYAASERDIADAANVTRRAAHNASRALVKRGALKVVQAYDKGAPSMATRWELLPVLPLLDCREKVPLPHACLSWEWYPYATHDAFRGLGSVAQVFTLLQDAPQTIAELVTASGRNRGTVWRALKSLEAAKAIKRTGSQWRAVTGAAMAIDRIADNRGKRGARAKQKHKHEAQRDAHRAKLKAGAQHD